MAADDKYQDSDSASKRTALDDDDQFVDRDDDSGFEFVDRDHDDDYPAGSEDSDDTQPDPGYAAFAGELEDPLADWPSPDSSLENLPEVRMQEAGQTTQSEEAGPSDDLAPEISKPDDLGDLPSESASTPPAEESMFADDDQTQPPGPDRVDFDTSNLDEFFANDAPPEPASVVDDSTNAFADLPEPPAADEVDPLPDPPEPDDIPFAPEAGELPGAPGADDLLDAPAELLPGDDLVDDFLNDLDPLDEAPDDPLGDVSIAPDTAGPESSMGDSNPALYAASEEVTSVELSQRSQTDVSYEASEADRSNSSAETETASVSSDEPRRRKGGKKTAPDKEERSVPVGMIAIVILALVLLGVGGYGVIKQRSSLEEEIRDLRAQLATTVTPEEADAERERQRQVELLNESLTAEVEALAAENADLANQLQALESQLAEQVAKAEAESKAASERIAAAQEESQRAATQPVAAPRQAEPTVAGGPWFVNFGSYAQKNVADRWANELQVGEGQVVVQTATAAGKTLYRVRVVGLDDQDQAERIATALERQYQLPRLWVGKN